MGGGLLHNSFLVTDVDDTSMTVTDVDDTSMTSSD